ncbi:MAG: class I adenylate-forming enzyme family protein [Gammaproteobacteria bacterium]
MDLARRIDEILSLDPQAEAIEDRGRWWRWSDVARLKAAIDRELDARVPGDGAPIGIILRTRFGPLAAELAATAGRRCVVPFSPMFGDAKLADEIRAQRVPMLVADAEDWARPGLAAACEAAGTAAFAIFPADDEPLRAVATPPQPAAQRHPSMPGVAVRMLTSGTTGTPKRISLTYAELDNMMTATAIYSRRSAATREQPQLSAQVEILAAPLVHTSGYTRALNIAADGYRFALLERFDPERWSRLIEAHKPIAGSLVPASMRMVLDANIPPERLATLRAVVVGTAALDPDTADEFTARYGKPVLLQYGATEFPGGLAGWTLPMYKEFWSRKRGSSGRAKPGVEFRVLDPDTRADLPPDAPGLIAVRTPATAGRGGDGWIVTADIGRLDVDGFIYIVGRADDAIVRGGFKILPQDVERVLELHPAVRAAGVVGRADPRLGTVPVAAVELAAPASPEEILAFAREHLASYQVPADLRIVDALPRTPSLKVAKPALRALLGCD